MKVTVQQFADEIKSDLQELITQYPDGIYYTHLMEYYGESISRVREACMILLHFGHIERHRNVSNAFFILPKSTEITPISNVALLQLTPLQRKLALFIARRCTEAGTSVLRTNCSQLSRVIDCSYGGLRACLDRLVALRFVYILSWGGRGKQDEMKIQVSSKLADAYEDTLQLRRNSGLYHGSREGMQ